MFKVNKRNTWTRCKICSKLTIKTPERRKWRRSGVFTVNFEYISHLVLVFSLSTLSRKMPDGMLIFKLFSLSYYSWIIRISKLLTLHTQSKKIPPVSQILSQFEAQKPCASRAQNLPLPKSRFLDFMLTAWRCVFDTFLPSMTKTG